MWFRKCVRYVLVLETIRLKRAQNITKKTKKIALFK